MSKGLQYQRIEDDDVQVWGKPQFLRDKLTTFANFVHVGISSILHTVNSMASATSSMDNTQVALDAASRRLVLSTIAVLVTGLIAQYIGKGYQQRRFYRNLVMYNLEL